MKTPAVSVVMSVYNGQLFLGQAIESVQNQSFSDFEFIIINDGSTDTSPKLLKTFAAKDQRIKLINQQNQGLVASLNRGIKQAKGKYIARQDADDASAPQRFEKQIDYLEAHPQAAVVGSSIEVMDNADKIMHRHAVLLNDAELRQELLVRSPFAHGSVMFRRQAAIDAGMYDQASWPAEDYDLWLRLSKFGQLANLDEYLYIYREHGQSISAENDQLQQRKLDEVRTKAWAERGRLLPKRQIKLSAYKALDMGQLRIERIFDNSVFISKAAWRNKQKSVAFKSLSQLAADPLAYRKAAGKLKRKAAK
jgi:glycosyltransferase involved in cell wall biosynthesis